MEEIWKDIEGYEGLYQISNLGRVKSLNYHRSGKEGILKPKQDKYGYLVVCLSKNNKHKYMTVHRLVAKSFCNNDNPQEKNQVNHIDENKQNNVYTNLEWCTPKENMNHGTRTERAIKKSTQTAKENGSFKGKNNPSAKKVRCIELDMIFDTMTEAMIFLNKKSITGICACCNNRCKTAYGYHWEYYKEDFKDEN